MTTRVFAVAVAAGVAVSGCGGSGAAETDASDPVAMVAESSVAATATLPTTSTVPAATILPTPSTVAETSVPETTQATVPALSREAIVALTKCADGLAVLWSEHVDAAIYGDVSGVQGVAGACAEARTQVSVDNSAAPGTFTKMLDDLHTVVSGLNTFTAVDVSADGISQLGTTIQVAAQEVRWVAACGLAWYAEYEAGRCELSSPATTTLPAAASGYNASTASDSDQFAKYSELVVAYGGELRLAPDNAEFGAHNFCDNSPAEMASFVDSISRSYNPAQGPAEAFAVADAYCPPARANIESAMTSIGRADEVIPSQA